MEIPSFDGRKVEAFAERFGRYLVLTGRTKAKSRVKANLIVQGIKDKGLQDRVSKVLKSSRSLEDFLGSLQRLYPHVETGLSVIEEFHKVQHLPYDPKPEAVANLLHDLDRNLNMLSPGALNEQGKLLHLASQINDRQLAEWTNDGELFRRMHMKEELADLMVERSELSVGLKHLAINRGIATGKASTNRYHAKNKESEGTPSREVASNSSQPSSSKGSKDLETSLKTPENIVAELRVSERGEKGKGIGKGGKGRLRGKGSGGGRGTGKSPSFNADTLIAEFKARIQCKHCGKTSHYSDHGFKYQKQQRFERLKAFLKQQGFSEEDATKVMCEMKNRPKFANDKPGKPAPKSKPAAKPAPVSTEEGEDPAAKKRERELQFSEVDKIVELLRSAAKQGLTL